MFFNAISVLGLIACLAAGTTGVAADLHALTRAGTKMAKAEKDKLEAGLKESPNDVEARTKLLGYYFLNERNTANAKAAKSQHVLWLIENAPEAEVLGSPYGQINAHMDPGGYVAAKEAWLKAMRKSPGNLKATKSAAAFFLQADREQSEELLLKGKQADPQNGEWAKSLGQLYSLGLMRLADGPEKQAVAKQAFEEYLLAYQLSGRIGRDSLLTDLAKTALAAGLSDEAKDYADKMLEDQQGGWNRGNRIHHGNLILGLIAMSKGDINEAKSRLLAAGNTPGSPQLNSFGPNMLLAEKLLEAGENEVVLEYFQLCSKFWKSPRRELDRWIKEVEAGLQPRFGGNLAY